MPDEPTPTPPPPDTTRKRRSKTIIEIDRRVAEQDRIIADADVKRSTLLELRASFEQAEASEGGE